MDNDKEDSINAYRFRLNFSYGKQNDIYTEYLSSISTDYEFLEKSFIDYIEAIKSKHILLSMTLEIDSGRMNYFRNDDNPRNVKLILK